jgi:hypothetical protein
MRVGDAPAEEVRQQRRQEIHRREFELPKKRFDESSFFWIDVSIRTGDVNDVRGELATRFGRGSIQTDAEIGQSHFFQSAERRHHEGGLGTYVPAYLDDGADRLLRDARAAAQELELGCRSIIAVGSGSLILPWVGAKQLVSLTLALKAKEVDASPLPHAIELPRTTPEEAVQLLESLAAEPAPSADAITARVSQPCRAKFDEFLPPDLLRLVTAVEHLDIGSIPETARGVIGKSVVLRRGE